MKKQDAQSIGEIIDRVLKEQNLDLKLDETRLIKAWNSLLGEQVASYTTKLYICLLYTSRNGKMRKIKS